MRIRKEVLVDGVKYDIGPINVTKSIKLMTKVTKILGPSLVKMLKDINNKKTVDLQDMEIKGESLELVLTEFFDRIDENTFEDVSRKILENTIHHGSVEDGQKGFGVINDNNFDLIFDRGVMHLFKVLKEAFGVTYSDFLGESGGFQSKIKASMESFTRNTR